MSDRPNGYGWLYDGDGESSAGDPDATRPARAQPRGEDPTQRVQRIPSRPRKDPAGSDRPTPPPAPPAPPRTSYPEPPRIAPEPGREPGRSTEYGGGGRPPIAPGRRTGGGRNGGGSGGSRAKKVVLGIVILVVVWAGLEVWAGLGSWGAVHKAAWEPGGHRPTDQPGTTYLMVGSDSRAGLTAKQRKEYHTGDDAGQRTDTIMLVHTGSGHSMVMSIPRDSLVDIPGHGTTKINAAFAYGGPKLLTRTIEHDTGIRIDGYVEIGMGGVANMVDAVGGITICPKTNMVDPLAGLNVKKGCQPADGQVALAFARSRHALATGDLGREDDQRKVIAQVMSKLKSPGIMFNPFRLHHVGTTVGKGLTVGKGMSLWQAYKLYGALKALTNGKAKSCATPISDWAVHWDPTRSKELFSYIKRDDVGSIPKKLCTATGLPS
jgi:LCP family protein required for cell wall assembly